MPAIKDVVIAMPCYDNKTEIEIHNAMWTAKNDPECVVSEIIHYNGDSLVTRARNESVLLFEQMPVERARFLIFIDSDIHFKPQHINTLRAHNERIVCGLYFLKNMNTAPVLNTPIGSPKGPLQQVREAGTGFMMIRRDVFASIRAMGLAKTYLPGSNQHLQGVQRTNFFSVDVVNNILMSEDYLFCHMAEQLGIPTYVDTTVVCGHKGWAMYPFKPHILVDALPAALSSFRDLPTEERVTDEQWAKVVSAFDKHRERNPIEPPKQQQPMERDFEVVTEVTNSDHGGA